jgi:hypothetical protein
LGNGVETGDVGCNFWRKKKFEYLRVIFGSTVPQFHKITSAEDNMQ